MIPLSSSLTGKTFTYQEAEQKLNGAGFKLADNWDYDHGYFDYEIDDHVGYQFLRLPFQVTTGSLDAPEDYALIEMNEPFLLSHKYNRGLDDHVKEGNIRAIFDQFQEPVDADASFPEEHIPKGEELLRKAENALLND